MTTRPRHRFSRRRFLKLGLAGGATAALVWYRAGYYPRLGDYRGLVNLRPRSAAILAAVVDAMLPPRASRSPIPKHVRAIDEYLTGLDANEVRLFHVLLYSVEHATLPFGSSWRRFSALSLTDRRECLEKWRRSRFEDCRLGLRSLATLVFLSYYRDEDAFRTVGYSGPILPGFSGLPASRQEYERLLAPPDRSPS